MTSTKIIFGLEIAPVRRYCGRHNWTLSVRRKKDVVWSNSLHLEVTKIRRAKMTWKRHRLDVSLRSRIGMLMTLNC